MRVVPGLVLAGFAFLLPGCTTPGSGVTGTGLNSNTWVCTSYDMNQEYFTGYGDSKEAAFESAMQQCKFNAPDATTCMGSLERCKPPSGGS